MLGEGFDLPELKIAAFHDVRKSLPITLQLIGRFTRYRSDLSTAKAVVNIVTLSWKMSFGTFILTIPTGIFCCR